MSSKTLQAFALRDDSELTLDRLEARLRERFPEWGPRGLDREDADELRVRAGNGSVRLWLREGMAAENAALAPGAAGCGRRLEVWASDKAPNDLLLRAFDGVCATAREFAGVTVLDVKGRPASVSGSASEPSAEELYQQARALWAEAIELSLYDDPPLLRRAAGILERAIKAEPRHARALALLADLLAALTAYAEAEEYARRVAEAEPVVAEHARRRELLALPNGVEKRRAIMGHLSVKWLAGEW